MTTLEILKAARELISVPERWTQNAYARDALGTSVDSRGAEACRWCVMGAIANVEPESGGQRAAIDELRSALGSGLAEFNDSTATTHTQVLALFDRAIARLESETSNG